MGKPCYKHSLKEYKKSSLKELSKKDNEKMKQEIEVLKNLILNKLKDKKSVEKAAQILSNLQRQWKK